MPESRNGRCCTFDADASGTMFGDGTGTVLLRLLSAPPAHGGDTVLAVVAGFGMNNDGKAKVSFNAPSVNGQREAVVRALKHAGAVPEAVSYVECHGTATLLGDPIEVAALTEAFAAQVSAKIAKKKAINQS
eukprot:3926364-Pyramimonas_sp.AAC.1